MHIAIRFILFFFSAEICYFEAQIWNGTQQFDAVFTINVIRKNRCWIVRCFAVWRPYTVWKRNFFTSSLHSIVFVSLVWMFCFYFLLYPLRTFERSAVRTATGWFRPEEFHWKWSGPGWLINSVNCYCVFLVLSWYCFRLISSFGRGCWCCCCYCWKQTRLDIVYR